MGDPWTLPAVAVVACLRHRCGIAGGALACLTVEKGAEVATKEWSQRPRPLYVQPTALRDDAPVEGASMPSGHAAIAACAAVLLVLLVPAPLAATVVVGTALSPTPGCTRAPTNRLT